jgi:hypothetical protein
VKHQENKLNLTNMTEKTKNQNLKRMLCYIVIVLAPMAMFAQKVSTLEKQLEPIQENFKRINSIENWSLIDKKELWETIFETVEGGEAHFYYLDKQLEKIITYQFGETFQVITEYYLLNKQLSFVFQKKYKYNRLVYYDLEMMEENNDSEMFDFEKSEIIEFRYYFEKEKLIHQLTRQVNKGSSQYILEEDYLFSEEKEIKMNFEELIKIAENNE